MKRNELKTPCYVIQEAALRKNGEILASVRRETGCKILLAQKCFSNYELYPILAEYLDGTEASGLYEARLGKEEMPNRECHVFSAAYREDEIDEIINYADHIVFNSIGQLLRYGEGARAKGLSVGLRVNPECSTQEGHEIYDPCAAGSRLGVRIDELTAHIDEVTKLIDGLHFHTLCEQDSDALEKTLVAFENKFGFMLDKLEWVNFGGGHHITRDGYDIERLKGCIKKIQAYGVTVYLEPGEAVALNAGVLITTVLDIVHANDEIPCAILDSSAACHMPDVLEMPYRPPLFGSDEEGKLAYTYNLGSQTCLAGDVIGKYSFDKPLSIGSRLTFGDMAIYTMVKTNTFNGMPLPDIVLEKADGDCVVLRKFDYQDFKSRL